MIKKSIQLMGHWTSISLEPEFWEALTLIAKAKKISLRQLVTQVDAQPNRSRNLSSALRVYTLQNKNLFELPTQPK